MPARPNILFLVADDHRYTAQGRLGLEPVHTPTLDQLAAEGVAFERATIMGGLTGAVCVPTRACMLTGVSTFRAVCSTQIDDYQMLTTIQPHLDTLPQRFHQAGYHTFATGKWHNDRESFARSFADGATLFFGGMSDHETVPVHDFDPIGEYAPADAYPGAGFSTELFAGSAIQFLQDYDGEAPFFLYCAFTSPHDPRTPPPPYDQQYNPKSLSIPPNFQLEHPFDNGELTVRDELLASFPRSLEEVQRHLADYYGMISHQDEWMGRILQTLEQTGRGENTLVVYVADHGLALGQHGLMGKQNLYDHSTRVPLLMRGPGLPAGRQITGLVQQMDIYPTLCELAGVVPPPKVEGKSLCGLVRGESDKAWETLFAVYKDVQRMVCDGRWKLIRYYLAENRAAGSEYTQLFDLVNDPYEMENRLVDPACKRDAARLDRALANWQIWAGDPLVG